MIARLATIGILALAYAVAAEPGRAEEPAPIPQVKTDGLILTLGGWGFYEPKFDGSTRYGFAPRPIFDIRGASEREWLTLPTDGIDFDLFETRNFHTGLVGNWRYALDVKDNAADRGFRRIGNINISLEAGGFAEYWPTDWLRTRIEVRRAFYGADGVIADASSDLVWHPAKSWTLTLGPRISFGNKEFMNAYYGVTPAQSAATGIRTYDASGGLRAYGVGTFARYKWNEQFSTMAYGDYQRIAGEAAESPLLTTPPGLPHHGTPDQFSFGLGFSYSFNLGSAR